LAAKVSNLIIEALPAEVKSSLLARLQPVELPVGTVLTNPGQIPPFAHFMTSGITSVVTFMSDGVGAEVGVIGREGLVEAISLLGPAAAPTTAFIQSEGTALRMPFADLQQLFLVPGPLSQRILECVQSQGFILSQLAACHGLHEIEERLARWLLMVRDRLESDCFELTQEFLAEMLGARRTSVTLAAGKLQRGGLIKYSRGRIEVIDRKGLEGAACECYPIVRDLVAQLYPEKQDAQPEIAHPFKSVLG
jgi:CRP-like cAMP-binding protein